MNGNIKLKLTHEEMNAVAETLLNAVNNNSETTAMVLICVFSCLSEVCLNARKKTIQIFPETKSIQLTVAQQAAYCYAYERGSISSDNIWLDNVCRKQYLLIHQNLISHASNKVHYQLEQ